MNNEQVPNISLFTHNYRRHNGFALEPMQYQPRHIQPSGINHGFGQSVTFSIPKYPEWHNQYRDPNKMVFTFPNNGHCGYCNKGTHNRCEQCRVCYCSESCKTLTCHKYSCIKEIDHLESNTVNALWLYIKMYSDIMTLDMCTFDIVLSDLSESHRKTLSSAVQIGLLELIHKMELFVRWRYMWNDYRVQLYVKIFIDTYKDSKDWTVRQSEMFEYLKDRSLHISRYDVLKICMKSLKYPVIKALHSYYCEVLTADKIVDSTMITILNTSLYRCLHEYHEDGGELPNRLLLSNGFQGHDYSGSNKFGQFMVKLKLDQCLKFPEHFDMKDQHIIIREICIAMESIGLIPDIMEYIIDLISIWTIPKNKRFELISSVSDSCFRIKDLIIHQFN